MSRQLVYVVSLEEVGRIRFRCRKCDHVDSIAPNKLMRRWLGQCSNCGEIWADSDTPAYEEVVRLCGALKQIPKIAVTSLGCIVELEIPEETASLPE